MSAEQTPKEPIAGSKRSATTPVSAKRSKKAGFVDPKKFEGFGFGSSYDDYKTAWRNDSLANLSPTVWREMLVLAAMNGRAKQAFQIVALMTKYKRPLNWHDDLAEIELEWIKDEEGDNNIDYQLSEQLIAAGCPTMQDDARCKMCCIDRGKSDDD